jgi:hypothetical protein
LLLLEEEWNVWRVLVRDVDRQVPDGFDNGVGGDI